MRSCTSIVGLMALTASAAFAQTMGGPNSMSPIPGTELPDKSDTDIEKKMRAIGEQRDGSATSAAYRENLRIRREQAKQYAAAARDGVPLPGDAAISLRGELAADIEQWRAEFRVGRKEWRAMRDRWLVPLGSLSSVEWALRRAAWWDERERWVAARAR